VAGRRAGKFIPAEEKEESGGLLSEGG